MTLSPRQTRFALIAGGVLVLAAAAAFVLNAFQNNLVFFFTPTQVLNGEAPTNKIFRIGGLVKVGSVQRNGTDVSFVVTDTAKTLRCATVVCCPICSQRARAWWRKAVWMPKAS